MAMMLRGLVMIGLLVGVVGCVTREMQPAVTSGGRGQGDDWGEADAVEALVKREGAWGVVEGRAFYVPRYWLEDFDQMTLVGAGYTVTLLENWQLNLMLRSTNTPVRGSMAMRSEEVRWEDLREKTAAFKLRRRTGTTEPAGTLRVTYGVTRENGGLVLTLKDVVIDARANAVQPLVQPPKVNLPLTTSPWEGDRTLLITGPRTEDSRDPMYLAILLRVKELSPQPVK